MLGVKTKEIKSIFCLLVINTSETEGDHLEYNLSFSMSFINYNDRSHDCHMTIT